MPEPIVKKTVSSEFSISAALNKKEEEIVEDVVKKDDDLPDHHFTDKDLQAEWQLFLEDLLNRDQVMYYAVNTLKIIKKDENLVKILYPSDSVKNEFEKIQGEFFNHFKRKVNNYKIEIEFGNDVSLKKEILTKRKIFEKFVEINPVLKDLDELMRFDLS
jgi:DNA polymerase-3 subunit gamma/tau